MLSTNSLDILNYCLIGLNIISACVLLNWTLCFSLLSHSECLKPRRPIISILIGIFNVIFCGVDRSQVLLHSNLSSPIVYPGWMIVNAICVELWVLTMFLIAYRAWMIYYSIKFNKALEDKEWRLYINPAEHNWFLKHRQSYGSSRKMIFAFMIPWFLTACVYWFLIYKSSSFTANSRVIIMVQTLMVMLFLIYIWSKIPMIHDVWRIRNELIITIRLFVFGVTIFFVFAVLFNWKPGNWRYALLSTVGTMSALSIGYAVLYYPLSRFHLPVSVCGALYLNKASIDKSIEIDKKKHKLHFEIDAASRSNKPSSKKWGNQFHKLKAILKHKDGFRLFAAHLMKEYAIEHLLFFVETSQWLQYLIQKCVESNIELSVDEKASQIDIKFHENIPKSRIVCWNRDDGGTVTVLSDVESTTSKTATTATTTATSQPSAHAQQLTLDLNLDEFQLSHAIADPWMQCIKLFHKYVVNGAYFCINISGETRIAIYELIGYDSSNTKCDEELVEILKEKCHNDMNELFHVFDTARYAVFRLMIWAVSRFETSESYLQHFMPCEHI